nr:hypothetical protein GCM10010200_100130 [Actinomadura rugatobispora]
MSPNRRAQLEHAHPRKFGDTAAPNGRTTASIEAADHCLARQPHTVRRSGNWTRNLTPVDFERAHELNPRMGMT